MSTKNNLVWWEKTVEYSFVLQIHQTTGKLIATPLSGCLETALGDAIIDNGLSLMLVEFKRNEGQISKELRKFDCYEDAQRDLENCSDHHIIIYGKEDSTGKNIKLWQINYFDSLKNDNSRIFDPSTVFTAAIDSSEFHAYIEKLVDYRKKDRRSGSGGHVLEVFESKNVCGITKNGECIVTVPLIDYCLGVMPDALMELGINAEEMRCEPERSSNTTLGMD